MSNWILDTVIENLKAKIEAKKTFIDMCEFERGNYVAWNETNDTFEAKNYEYWRTAKVMAEIQLKELETELNEINDMFNLEEINLGDFTYLSNSRQISLVKKAVEISKNLEDALNNDVPIDLLEIDIKEICEILGEIIGESYDDKLIDTLFSNFCLGK